MTIVCIGMSRLKSSTGNWSRVHSTTLDETSCSMTATAFCGLAMSGHLPERVGLAGGLALGPGAAAADAGQAPGAALGTGGRCHAAGLGGGGGTDLGHGVAPPRWLGGRGRPPGR